MEMRQLARIALLDTNCTFDKPTHADRDTQKHRNTYLVSPIEMRV